MRWEVVAWGALALLPGVTLLWQVVAFVVLSVVAIQCYRRWGRPRARASDAPLLNRRGDQLLGRVVPLLQGIVSGQGRVSIDDASWQVQGPDLPAGTLVRVVAVQGTVLVVEPATA